MKPQLACRAILLLVAGGVAATAGCSQHQDADTAVPGGNQPSSSSTALNTPPATPTPATPATGTTSASPPAGVTPVNGGTSGNPAGAVTAAH